MKHEKMLAEWEQHPGQEDEDGYFSPTLEAIRSARSLLPLVESWRMVMGASGNIVFSQGDCEIMIWDGGNAEWIEFHDCKVMSRTEIIPKDLARDIRGRVSVSIRKGGDAE